MRVKRRLRESAEERRGKGESQGVKGIEAHYIYI
jgi:hypothetical protein